MSADQTKVGLTRDEMAAVTLCTQRELFRELNAAMRT